MSTVRVPVSPGFRSVSVEVRRLWELKGEPLPLDLEEEPKLYFRAVDVVDFPSPTCSNSPLVAFFDIMSHSPTSFRETESFFSNLHEKESRFSNFENESFRSSLDKDSRRASESLSKDAFRSLATVSA